MCVHNAVLGTGPDIQRKDVPVPVGSTLQNQTIELYALHCKRPLKTLLRVSQSCPTLCDPMDCGPARLLRPGDSPGKNTGVGCHSLLQGIFLTQGSNPGLPHCRQILYRLHVMKWGKGKSLVDYKNKERVVFFF